MSAAILVLLLVVLVLARVPLAVALGAGAAASIAILGREPLMSVAAGIFRGPQVALLFSIPLFVLASALLTSNVTALRTLRFADACLGRLRGHGALSCALGAFLFSAISGSSSATIAAVGCAAADGSPSGDAARHDIAALLCGVGAIALVTPPSIALVVFAVVTGTDLADLFLAAIVPAVLLFLLLAAVAWRRVHAPADAGRHVTARAWLASAAESAWSLLLVVLIVWALNAGLSALATALLATIYAFAVAVFLHRDIGAGELPRIALEAARNGGMLLLLAAGGLLFAAALGSDALGQKIAAHAAALGVPRWAFLAAVDVLMIVAAAFLEPTAIIAIVAPVIVSAASAMGIDDVRMGIVMAASIGVGMAMPPLGLNLFVASATTGIAPREMSQAMRPWIAVLLVLLAIVTFVPLP